MPSMDGLWWTVDVQIVLLDRRTHHFFSILQEQTYYHCSRREFRLIIAWSLCVPFWAMNHFSHSKQILSIFVVTVMLPQGKFMSKWINYWFTHVFDDNVPCVHAMRTVSHSLALSLNCVCVFFLSEFYFNSPISYGIESMEWIYWPVMVLTQMRLIQSIGWNCSVCVCDMTLCNIKKIRIVQSQKHRHTS